MSEHSKHEHSRQSPPYQGYISIAFPSLLPVKHDRRVSLVDISAVCGHHFDRLLGIEAFHAYLLLFFVCLFENASKYQDTCNFSQEKIWKQMCP